MRAMCERRRGIVRGWLATAGGAVATIAMAAWAAGVPPARAQEPADAKAAALKAEPEARPAMEARENADYYINNNQPDKAKPYLEAFRASRPIELYAASDYYIRRNQPDKAVPFLDELLKRRLDPAT